MKNEGVSGTVNATSDVPPFKQLPIIVTIPVTNNVSHDFQTLTGKKASAADARKFVLKYGLDS